MPFFDKGNAKISNVPTTSETTYTDADYYIANTEKKAQDWQIKDNDGSIINNSIDTSRQVDDNGPADYDGYYNNTKAAKLFISHVPTGYSVAFPAFLDSYSEDFKPNFSAEQVYGRMDPIQRYQNTSRTISVTWKVVAYDEDHAHRNLHALSALSEFLYPVYDGLDKSCSNATVIRESPLLRVRFANLIQKNGRDGTDVSSIGSYINNGLLVAPSTFNFVPNVEAGFFFHDAQYLFPKEIKISMNFSVLHEETPGWFKTGSKYHWIGKLNSNGNMNGKATDFPWGNDVTADEGGGSSPADATMAQLPSSSPAEEDFEFGSSAGSITIENDDNFDFGSAEGIITIHTDDEWAQLDDEQELIRQEYERDAIQRKKLIESLLGS